jgi:phytoene synthase
VESDLSPPQFETFDDLRRYCYQVAGAVGLCCIHVWGFHDERAPERAVDCGLAFQLTNILRDLGEDAQVGRIYLPRRELAQFEYAPQDLAAGVRNDCYRELMRFQVARAREFYARAGALYESVDRRGGPVLSVMFQIYGGLLEEIERRDYDVFSRRVRISTLRKLSIVVRSMLGHRFRMSNAEGTSRRESSVSA